jgi:hypothetical protein
MVVVRALPASCAARLRCRCHFVGARRLQRQATPWRSLHQLRQQRCNTSAPRLGRQSYWLSTLSNPRRLPNGSRCAMTRMSPQPDTEEVLAGLVERVTYHNAENGFCVLRARARGHPDVVTPCCGHFRRRMDHGLGPMGQRPHPWPAVQGAVPAHLGPRRRSTASRDTSRPA